MTSIIPSEWCLMLNFVALLSFCYPPTTSRSLNLNKNKHLHGERGNKFSHDWLSFKCLLVLISNSSLYYIWIFLYLINFLLPSSVLCLHPTPQSTLLLPLKWKKRRTSGWLCIYVVITPEVNALNTNMGFPFFFLFYFSIFFFVRTTLYINLLAWNSVEYTCRHICIGVYLLIHLLWS